MLYRQLIAVGVLITVAAGTLFGCSPSHVDKKNGTEILNVRDISLSEKTTVPDEKSDQDVNENDEPAEPSSEEAFVQLGILEDYRSSFVHGEKPIGCQSYIVIHDTESWGDPSSIIDYWDGNGAGVASHFIVGTDGSIVQCVPLDKIAHHAGFGDTGHNELFDTLDESRDDRVGTAPIGSWAPDYGMNSYSIGIELVHVGGEGSYPIIQLEALDRLVAYLDIFYADTESGNAGMIIDHKTWRSGNSDTSPEFAGYLTSYQENRTHVA